MNTNTEPLVLMADDDEDDCTLARNAFKESGARGIIRCIENGMELMDYLSRSESAPVLILLDLNMPIKDGRQALKEIKSTPAFQHIPVVVFTTSRDHKDIAYSVQMGAQSFITKPNTFGEWVSIMKSLADKWLLAV